MDDTEVRQSIGQVDVQPGVDDHNHGLEGHEDQGEEADDGAGDVVALGVEVDDEIFDELQEMINEGSQTKDNRALSQEPAPVRLDVVVAGWQPGEIEEEVEEEETGDRVEETEHEQVEVGLEVSVGQLVDCHRDVDGEDQQAVQT